MEKKTKIGVSIVFAIILVFLSIVLFKMDIVASSPDENSVSASPINITRLDVNATVHETGKVDVVESFDVKFNQSGLHEVIRFIPYACYQYRKIDGKVKKNVVYAQITDVGGVGDHSETFNTYIDEIAGYITFGLKDAAGFSYGETRTFSIKYSYFMGNDKNKGFDDVYYNLVGTNSTCEIENVSFSVTLPKEVETGKIQMYSGVAGSTAAQEFTVLGNVVSGTCARLEAGEGITFRAIFEDGYLTKVPAKLNLRQLIAIGLCLGCVAFALVCFFVLRQKNNYPKPVELVPYDGLDPFVADYMANASVSTKTVSASVICLANMGYLTIEDKGNKNIVFHKTEKDISELKNVTLEMVYNAVFSGGVNEKEMSRLGVDFATSVSTIQSAEKIKQKSSLYDQKETNKYGWFKFGVLALMFITALVVFKIPKSFFGFSTDLFNFVNVAFALFLVYAAVSCFFEQKNLWIYTLISTSIFIVIMALVYARFSIGLIDKNYIGFIVLIILSALPVLVNVTPKYSQAGAISKGRVLGFKNYISMCEVSQLKMFALENPNYYFDVLPYAYVFGLSKVWMDKFKDIEVKVPDWMISSNGTLMDYVVFNSMFNNFNQTMSNNIQAEKFKAFASTAKSFTNSSGRSSGHSGGFGGGGFSGGGGGGGGFGAR